MANNPPGEPERPAEAPRPSPPTRKQRREPDRPPVPPSPRTRVQGGTIPPPERPASPPRPDAPPRQRGSGPAGSGTSPAGAPSPGAPPGTPSPATRLQGSETPTRGTSGRAPAGNTDPPTRREAHNTARREFPQGLRDRYEPYDVAGAGSEGTVWHVRRLADGSDAAVKIAHPGQTTDLDTLEHLATEGFQRHVPRIHEFGEVAVGPTVCGWVAMEYLPTTLEDHLLRRLREGTSRADRADTERTVRELAHLLDFWQTRIDRNPLDLKPANILVREVRGDGSGSGRKGAGRAGRVRHEFVVADFGGVARFTASQSFRDFQITVLYMAPEQLVPQNLRATPWWTLGLVLYQVFTGRPLYVLNDDARVTDEAWTRALILNHEADLSAVTDPRQKRLLQGLLTKDPDDRWTAGEVRRWLKGEDPPVIRPVAPAAPSAARHANRPLTFRGTAHHDAESLASTMARYSQEAADWLAGPGGPALEQWLRKDLKDTAYDRGQLLALRQGQDRPARAAAAALSFVAAFAPTASPQYRGRRVDAEGIARIAHGRGAVTLVDELLRVDVPTIAAGFRCAHAGCGEGPCSVLIALADELPATIEDVRGRAAALGRRGGGDASLDRRETDRAYGLAAGLIVHPEQQRRQALLPLAGLPGPLAALLSRAPARVLVGPAVLTAARHRAAAVLHRRDPGDAAFLRRWAALHGWAARASVTTVPGRGALVAAAVLLPRALRADVLGEDHEVTFFEWWSGARGSLAQRLGAAAVLLLMFWLLLWSGSMLRSVHDSGLGPHVLQPADALTGTLAQACDVASATQSALTAVALTGAVAIAAAPAAISRRLLLLVAAVVTALGCASPDLPPLDRLHAPGWLAERLALLLGGWRSWNGVVALVVLPLVCLLLLNPTQWLLRRARETEQVRAGLRRERTEQRRARAGLPRRAPGNTSHWRAGWPGGRDRALFVASALLTLVMLLWAAVELRVALDGDHPTLASWGTGQQGADYQSQYTLVCAAVCALAALGPPLFARRVFLWAAAAVAVLGLWPPPVEPARALSMPVLPDLFSRIAGTWGHASFWAASLLALPLCVYLGGFALHRTRRAAR
ncbi:protein kinase domain-containing protein [Streptomyces longwoodensis]|uniref:protein kinase domain-containing protein n=2 Tax=Streptomyces TaxID=1883 RepID=UPI0036FB54F5